MAALTLLYADGKQTDARVFHAVALHQRHGQPRKVRQPLGLAVHVCAAVGKADVTPGFRGQERRQRGRLHALDAPQKRDACDKGRARAARGEHCADLRVAAQTLDARDKRGIAVLHDGLNRVVVVGDDGLGGQNFNARRLVGQRFERGAQKLLPSGQNQRCLRYLQRALCAACDQLVGMVAPEYVNDQLHLCPPARNARRDAFCVRGRGRCRP